MAATRASARRQREEPPAAGGARSRIASSRFTPHRKVILGAIAVVVVAAIVTWLVAFSSVFGVRTVTVHGTRALSVHRVLTAAGIAHGTPIVRLDTADVAHRIEGLPGVASAAVMTSFPSTVTITVTERVPVGVVRSGKQFVLVDRTGDQFRTVRKRPAGLPLFVVPKGTDARTTGGAVATVASALSGRLRHRITSIHGLDASAITLLMRDHTLVRWGSADRSTQKARILPVLLRQAARQGATEIDLTDPDLPFTR